MTDLAQRMVEAGARAIAKHCGYEWELLSNIGRAGYFDLARACLTAALALAEGDGVVLVKVPEKVAVKYVSPAPYGIGWNDAVSSTLAGKVTL